MRRASGVSRQQRRTIGAASALVVAAFLVGWPLRLTTAHPPQDIRALQTQEPPRVHTMALSDGRTLGVYLDPDRAGLNGLHGTFFDAQGRELDLARAPLVTATGPLGRRVTFAVVREGPGHFYSDGDFEPGGWKLDVVATTRTGEVLRADLTVQL